MTDILVRNQWGRVNTFAIRALWRSERPSEIDVFLDLSGVSTSYSLARRYHLSLILLGRSQAIKLLIVCAGNVRDICRTQNILSFVDCPFRTFVLILFT